MSESSKRSVENEYSDAFKEFRQALNDEDDKREVRQSFLCNFTHKLA